MIYIVYQNDFLNNIVLAQTDTAVAKNVPIVCLCLFSVARPPVLKFVLAVRKLGAASFVSFKKLPFPFIQK